MRFLCAWLTHSLDLRDCFITPWVPKEPGFSYCSFLPHRSGQFCSPRICSTPSCFVLVGFAAGVLSCLRLGVPPFVVLVATGAWLVFALPCNLAAGIIFSLAMPYRINPGRITRPAGAQANTLPAVLIQLWSARSRVVGVLALLVFEEPVATRAHIFGIGRGRISFSGRVYCTTRMTTLTNAGIR